MPWYEKIPWDWMRHAYRSFRKTFFTRPRPTGSYVLAEADEDWLVRTLGARSYAPNWEMSYRKKGEDINLARVIYDDDHEIYDDNGYKIVWWQYHVRGWKAEPGVWHLRCHYEPEPTEYDEAHIRGRGLDIERAMNELREILGEAKIAYETIYVGEES